MPQSKPTQVIVHRIELQTTERKLLDDYLQAQETKSYIEAGIKAAGAAAVGGGIAAGAWLVIKGWAGVQAALLEPIEDAAEAIGGLFAPVSNEEEEARSTPNKVKDWTPYGAQVNLLQSILPEGSAARQYVDAGERLSDDFVDGFFGLFGL